jgi:type I restriction enzyme, S subunit
MIKTAKETTATISIRRFKPYPVYKDSGVEWLRDIPANWVTKKIKYNTYAKGRIGWQNLRSDEFIDEGPYLITGMHFKDGGVDWDSCYHIAKERFDMAPEIQVLKDDLLITKDGTIGKLAFIDKLPGPASLNSHLLVLRPLKKEYEPRYMFYLLGSEVFQHYVLRSQSGTTFYGITQEAIVNYPAIFPEVEEQKSIAAFLDRETARIDQLIAKKERQIELLQEKRSAIISNAVTKGLNPKANMKDSGIEWLGEIPEHWNIKRLKYMSTVNDEALNEDTDPTHEILYVDISSVNSMQGIVKKDVMIFETAPSRARRKVRNGDVIVSTVRTYLRAIAPIIEPESNLIVSTGFAVVRPTKDLESKFAEYALRANYFVDTVVARSAGVSYPAINASELITIDIILPPVDEQVEIAFYLNRETYKIDALISRINDSIEKLREYRTALISAAVTGKIDVREEVA